MRDDNDIVPFRLSVFQIRAWLVDHLPLAVTLAVLIVALLLV
jgi:hypothetical protein